MTKELATEVEMYQYQIPIGALRESTTILKQTYQESPPL